MKKTESFQFIHLILALVASFLLHLAVYTGAFFIPTPTRVLPTLPVEVVYKQTSPSTHQSFVSDPDLGTIEKNIQDKARFISKLNRRVKEETIAKDKENGLTQKNQTVLSAHLLPRTLTKPSSSESKSQAKSNKKSLAKPLFLPPTPEEIENGQSFIPPIENGQSFIPPAEPKNQSEDSSRRQVLFSGSTQGEYIPNVKEGNFTALNTDQFLYYTFFARINEQIRSRWISAMTAYSSSLSIGQVTRLSNRSRVTVVEVYLQPNGYIHKISLKKSSGDEGLDQTPIAAFNEASPFLNPPLEMVESDGFIHLVYSFHIEWQPRYWVKQKD